MAEFLQMILEIILQILLQAFADVFDRKVAPIERRVLAGVVYLVVGSLVGWLTTLLFPHSFIDGDVARIAYVVVVPVLIGFVMWRVGRAMMLHGKHRSSLETFWYGWLFALAFAIVRYLATE